MRSIVYIAITLSAFDLFGYKSPLPTYKDYVFTLPVNTNRITGNLMGPGGDYSAMRVEDVAFIYEAVCERNAVIAGTYDGFSVTNEFTIGLVKGSFPLSYTNKYPRAICNDQAVVAYYDTNVVTNVTARLGIDTLWPESVSLSCASGWIDKDEKWPTDVEDATVKGSGDAAYVDLPKTVIAPTYANPQATNSVTNVLQFVVWPLKASVVEAYKFLAKTEKCVKQVRDAVSREYPNILTVDNTTGDRIALDLDLQNESVSLLKYPAKDPSSPGVVTNSLNNTTAEWFGSNPAALLGGVGKRWGWRAIKTYRKVYTTSYDPEKGTKNWTDGQEASATEIGAFERTVGDTEIVIDLGISKDVATTGVDRIKRVDVYFLGEIRNSGENNYMYGQGHPDRFGGEGDIKETAIVTGFKDLRVVIPLIDQTVVDVPHTNRVTNPATGGSESNVSYTVGVKITPDVDGWASQALELAGYDSYGQLSTKLLNDLPDPNDSPTTPSPEKSPSFIWGWDSTSSSTFGEFNLVFTAYSDRAVVTCELGTRIQDKDGEGPRIDSPFRLWYNTHPEGD